MTTDAGKDRPWTPQGSTVVGDRVYDAAGNLIELFDGEWRKVVDASRTGWWRFHRHYDRNGYCDNPSRGY